MNPKEAIAQFISSRPGFDFNNYGDIPAYRADVAEAGRQLNDARKLLRYVEMAGIPITDANFRSFGGRLSFDGVKLDYCAGQYYPLEYRRAAAAVLASAIWHCWNEQGLGVDAMRRKASLAFGRRIASKYFN